MNDILNKRLLIITIVLFVVLFVQSVFHPIDFKSLKGFYNPVEKPVLSYKTLVNGSYQRDFENYQQYHFGFREWAIRLYNQYLWSCYNKTNNGWIEIGKDDWLYESEFVQDHYESLMYKLFDGDAAKAEKQFEETAKNLRKLQEILAKHNTHIFVNMIPGKDVIYPEYLPENTKYFNPDGIHAYDFYKKKFDEFGVNYIDFVEVFKNDKGIVDYPLFAKTGTHWTNIAATHAFDSIMRYMEDLGGMNMLNVEIGPKHRGKVRQPDDDLEQLFNLMFPIKPNSFYYAETSIIPDETAMRPKLITIGDSFFWTISYNYNLGALFSECPYWYYNSTIYYDKDFNSTRDVNMIDELFNSDFIMLNYCTVQLYKLGNGFIENALTLLYDKDTDSPVNDDIIEIERRIYSDSEWFNSVKEKAANNSISIEKQVALDARYVYNQQNEN